MLEALSPREFEDWCHVLIERVFSCRVEQTPYVGDEGRDLIVHDPAGLIIIECKHQPRGAVGRPVIQKLLSAIITAGSSRGMVLTTGRFAKAATEYAASLDISIDLVDGVRLAHMAATHGIPVMRSQGAGSAGLALRSISDAEFNEKFTARVFSSRLTAGNHPLPTLDADRATNYVCYYVGEYSAHGQAFTSGGIAEASWKNSIWIHGADGAAGTGNPPFADLASTPVVTIGEALEDCAGSVAQPTIPLHDAARRMKSFIMRTHTESVTYRGGNNQRYTKHIRPSARNTDVWNVKALYVPLHRFTATIGDKRFEGQYYETQGTLAISSPALNTCITCKTYVDSRDQAFCARCHAPVHRASFLRPDSTTCSSCRAVVCAEHAAQAGARKYCGACAPPDARKYRRLLPHLAILSVGVLVGAAIVLMDLGSGLLAFGISGASSIPLVRVLFPSGSRPAWAYY